MIACDIRPASPEDCDALVPLWADFFAEDAIDVPRERIAANLSGMLGARGTRVWVAEAEGRAIGLVSVAYGWAVECGQCMEIEDLYVLPTARRQGLARRLIATVLDWGAARGITEVGLRVTPEAEADQGLIAFYRQFGFEPDGRVLMWKSG